LKNKKSKKMICTIGICTITKRKKLTLDRNLANLACILNRWFQGGLQIKLSHRKGNKLRLTRNKLAIEKVSL